MGGVETYLEPQDAMNEPLEVRIALLVSKATNKEIEDFRYMAGFPNRNEALRRLIELGLEAARAATK